MALTNFQRDICRQLAARRIAGGESYVADGVALNELLAAPRRSQDIDLFHDTDEALEASWEGDRRLLEEAGYGVRVVRERPSFVEAQVSKSGEAVVLQWTRDSAYRFFPLVEHPDFGATLQPFDLATNKLLALVGRSEVRDWVDTIECDRRLQPLGYLAWAACGKDPGFGPAVILELAAASHYAAAEVLALAYDAEPPDPAELSRHWRKALDEARRVIDLLPPERAGSCVLEGRTGDLYRGSADHVAGDLDALSFHAGRIRGAFPRIRSGP